jgi:hypothetical protein
MTNSTPVFDCGSFIQESETAWTKSEITSFVIEGNLQVMAELWVKHIEYLSENPYSVRHLLDTRYLLDTNGFFRCKSCYKSIKFFMYVVLVCI